MIIINIIGGLGNQMFQYALGYSVAQQTKQTLKLDINDLDNDTLRNYELALFNINNNLISKKEANKLRYKQPSLLLFYKVLRKLFKIPIALNENHYKENDFSFDDKVFDIKNTTYFSGYWQSEKYFKKYRNDIIKIFTLKNDIHAKTKAYQKQIKKQMQNSVSLHIRRGDYANNPTIKKHHGLCSMDYYKQAITLLSKETTHPHFFIFSDDMKWVKENLHFIKNKTFIDLDDDIPPHETIFLMSKCSHNIIANSSFSWWGAWLNTNKNKIVIAPKKWNVDPLKNAQHKDKTSSTWISI